MLGATAEPWGPRLWLAWMAAVGLVACLQAYGMASWPMVDDEVPSLVEMGMVDIPASTFSVPPDQVGRLARTNPVWYTSQAFLLAHLPDGVFWYRLPSLAFAVMAVAVAFLLAARTAGLSMAFAVALVLAGSPLFLLISQVNRFYALPLLLLLLAMAALWWPRRGLLPLAASLVAATLAILSHNLTMVAFVLAFLASIAAWPFVKVPIHVVVRSGAAAVLGLALYFLYIRPLIAGWNSTGNPTPVLVSFSAHAGMPVLALAGLGAWFVLRRYRALPFLSWTLVYFAGSICVFLLAGISWNPRYFLFFMPAMWILAAYAVATVGTAVGGGWSRLAWLGCVALVLSPGVLSHLIDGSRHDYRTAAEVLVAHARDGQTILSDDAETISYYLPLDLREHLLVRTKVTEPPTGEYFLVTRANVWTELPVVPGRRMDVLAEIRHRRFDQFSHILRVYRVESAAP